MHAVHMRVPSAAYVVHVETVLPNANMRSSDSEPLWAYQETTPIAHHLAGSPPNSLFRPMRRCVMLGKAFALVLRTRTMLTQFTIHNL